jgi:hypothetical protein
MKPRDLIKKSSFYELAKMILWNMIKTWRFWFWHLPGKKRWRIVKGKKTAVRKFGKKKKQANKMRKK